ncbi:hypothetical protein RGL59_004837 [Vibrio parahaemolyticus]|uniref:hypothetical protein n=1 Tax=Vibrio parahaemolyticus TaxID=670 RepID=UPI000FEC24EA|nr:hypothetical protein [Vibrio parahaemolyticus]EJC6797912.1 hypothetical protein [Vibrio parahaemolyticus]EJC7056096.1 hypothetical protein [Vibrio parahaemolyticus]EJC7057041.1 hypothetical protein [Vibrio parahaemolyticus]EJC7099506.1 hypothetical protein [Vibrio parahaemolyticus]EJC7113256.1 hypothetical protein [Vibrio parahaemolyticus]
MRLVKETYSGVYDLAILGLGYEDRASSTFDALGSSLTTVLAIGYEEHTDKFNYQALKEKYQSSNIEVIEGNDQKVVSHCLKWVSCRIDDAKPMRVLIDITVMSRSRLSAILYHVIDLLPKGSKLTVTYQLSDFVEAPEGLSPIKKVGEIIPELSGDIGDLTLPTSVIVGLGYEKGKALGLVTLIDAEYQYLCIPKGLDKRFDECVELNNDPLINATPLNNKIYYNVELPYNTYLDLRDLLISVSSFSNPMLVPLGPKILAAICLVLGKEFGDLPVWRVSSEHSEIPVNRKASGKKIDFIIES